MWGRELLDLPLSGVQDDNPGRLPLSFIFCVEHKYYYHYDDLVVPGIRRKTDLTLQEFLTAWFFLVSGVPQSGTLSDQYDFYLAQLRCDNEDIIHLYYDVESKKGITFTQPVKNKVPDGWTYIIRPPFPIVDLPGNLLLEIKRRKEDDKKITAPQLPKLGSEGIKVWAYPQNSDLADRRLIVCANKLRYSGVADEELRRYVLGRDLAPSTKPVDPFQDYKTSPEKAREFQAIVDKATAHLSESLKGAVKHILETEHPLACRQGPSGAGKTTVAAPLAQICHEAHKKPIMGCQAIAPTDHLAGVIDKNIPQMATCLPFNWSSRG